MATGRRSSSAAGHVIVGGVRPPNWYTQLPRRSVGVLFDAQSVLGGAVCQRSIDQMHRLKKNVNDKCRCAESRSSAIHQRLTMLSARTASRITEQRLAPPGRTDKRTNGQICIASIVCTGHTVSIVHQPLSSASAVSLTAIIRHHYSCHQWL